MEETPQQKATMPADTSIVQSGNQVGHIDALGDGAGSQHGDSTYTGALPTLLFSVGPPFGLWSPGLSFPIELEECVGPQPKGRQRGFQQSFVAAAGGLLFAGGSVAVQVQRLCSGMRVMAMYPIRGSNDASNLELMLSTRGLVAAIFNCAEFVP